MEVVNEPVSRRRFIGAVLASVLSTGCRRETKEEQAVESLETLEVPTDEGLTDVESVESAPEAALSRFDGLQIVEEQKGSAPYQVDYLLGVHQPLTDGTSFARQELNKYFVQLDFYLASFDAGIDLFVIEGIPKGVSPAESYTFHDPISDSEFRINLDQVTDSLPLFQQLKALSNREARLSFVKENLPELVATTPSLELLMREIVGRDKVTVVGGEDAELFDRTQALSIKYIQSDLVTDLVQLEPHLDSLPADDRKELEKIIEEALKELPEYFELNRKRGIRHVDNVYELMKGFNRNHCVANLGVMHLQEVRSQLSAHKGGFIICAPEGIDLSTYGVSSKDFYEPVMQTLRAMKNKLSGTS